MYAEEPRWQQLSPPGPDPFDVVHPVDVPKASGMCWPVNCVNGFSGELTEGTALPAERELVSRRR
jgi:hypothetical protein